MGDDGNGLQAQPEEPEGNKMNTYFGVFQPCMLNIFGAIIFLRLSWGVGEVGFLGVLSIFGLAGFAVTMTALSIAAISTNGLMKGGGAYFMISRCLGPELGGACGVMFYCATSFAVSFYLVAFADTVEISFFDTDVKTYTGNVLISSVTLFILFAYANAGAEIFLKANTIIFFFLMTSIVGGFAMIFAGGEKTFTLSNTGDPTEASFRPGGSLFEVCSNVLYNEVDDTVWWKASTQAALGSASWILNSTAIG